ncbi:MAG: hypothetical protein ACRD2C_00720 [Acidimicrobiales bacterium]
MADLTSLLERTTPDDLAPLDLNDVARRARRRNRRKRAALATTCVAVVIAMGATAVAVVGQDRPEDETDAVWAGPAGEPLTEPVGSWTQAEDPPFSPRSETLHGRLTDGRVLLWGGFEYGPNGGGLQTDGGIFDPSTGVWEAIPPAPMEGVDIGVIGRTWLTRDRLAVYSAGQSQDDRLPEVAVYDVATGRWFADPWFAASPPDVARDSVMAWDGETFALIDVEGGAGTWRWRLGADTWEQGAPAPLARRVDAGSAFDGRRLAVWGGAVDGAGIADGAIYDVAADRWTMLPPAPVPGGEHPTVAWFEGQLLVGSTSGHPASADNADLGSGGAATFDTVSGTWERLPSPPDRGEVVAGPPYAERSDSGRWSWLPTVSSGPTPFVLSAPNGGRARLDEPTDHLSAAWFWRSGEWVPTRSGNLFQLGPYVAAVVFEDPDRGRVALALRVRDVSGRWLDATGAPLGHRIEPAIVATGDKLVVVGGWSNSGHSPRHDTWVFDLAG